MPPQNCDAIYFVNFATDLVRGPRSVVTVLKGSKANFNYYA